MQLKSHSLLAILTLLTLVSCGKKADGTADEITSGATVFGPDDRIALNAQTKIERAIGQLKGKYPSSEKAQYSSCSATVLSGDYLITAAHCVLNNKGERPTELYFYPQIKGNVTYPHGRYRATDIYYPAKYQANQKTLKDFEYDMAIIKVDKNGNGNALEDKVTGLGLDALLVMDQGTPGASSTMGYPGDKPASVPFKQASCSHTIYNKLQFKTDCDIFRGQSGSSFFHTDPKTKVTSLIGIVVAETSEYNVIARMTDTRLQIIESIINENFSPNGNSGERWNHESLSRADQISILVHNKCKNEILVAYSVMKSDGTWMTEGFFSIRTGQTMQVAQTQNGTYYLSSMFKTSKQAVIQGKEKIAIPGSGSHFFERFNKGSYGDALHTVSQCDG
ncbi:trypsin-like serine peptidase [Peredibacter starrii]|uniref:Trypsin-like serine protease n=1 Tax=Peredibacter starrii TaxID=28202 RepID=A0AAX4HMT8_9BACT|nr:trypsin-like serine protease [Peredibacter starrii]WPU64515.1 trypsin-like serine protease [Peredibacter starrii]